MSARVLPVKGDRVCTRYGEAVFCGEFWVRAKLAELVADSVRAEKLHKGFCTCCHRLWADTWSSVTCAHCGCGVRLDGIAGACPVNPTEGLRVTTERGEAVFDGYCWLEAWLYDALVAKAAEGKDDEEDCCPTCGYDCLCVAELGGCGGCGAYWGNCTKVLGCVFCGRTVHLT